MTDLSIPVIKTAGAVFIAALFYIYLLNRLAVFVQPIRLKLAREGSDLLRGGGLSQKDMPVVVFYLSKAYDATPVFWGVILFPVGALLAFIKAVKTRFQGKVLPKGNSSMERMAFLFSVSILAANPFLGAILLLEFLAFAIFIIITTAQLDVFRLALGSIARFEMHIPKPLHKLS